MIKIHLWFAMLVPVLTIDEDTFRKSGATPKLPDARTILSNLKEAAPNSSCSRDFERYALALGHQQWAMQMSDSMEKVPYGLIYGRTHYLGNFDECIYANAGNFTGKHCMVDLILDPSPLVLRTARFVLSYGICVPSTCTASEIRSGLDEFGLERFNVTVRVLEEYCWTSDPVDMTTKEWIVMYGSFGVIAVSSTVFDVMHRQNKLTSNRSELFSSFSLVRNARELTQVSSSPSNVGCLHGVRSLTICWIILCHEYVAGYISPLMNQASIVPEFVTSPYKIPILNGFVAVDTFFFLSGLLVAVAFFRSVTRTGSYDVPVAMIHRFLRLTPAFAAAMLIQSTIVPKLGRGPMWHKVIGLRDCKDSWWNGLLYIQNFIKPSSSCLGQSWYLSTDMQMFWLSPLLLYPLLFWRVKGVVLVLLGLAVALTTNFVVAFVYELGPHLLMPISARQFELDYTQTHMRLTPYIVGMALGYVICGIKTKKLKVNLSKVWTVLGWLISAGLCLASMYGVMIFAWSGFQGTPAVSSAYLTFHRLGWSLGLAWVIFACTTGYGGPVDYLLSFDIFQIIGKISYCMFLVHESVQFIKTGLLRTDFYGNDFVIVSNYLSSLLFSVMISVPLYLFFEAPFSNLDRYFLRGVRILPYPRRGVAVSEVVKRKHGRNHNYTC